MNSDNVQAISHGWTTSDGSGWWLRDTTYQQPSGDYTANCYMDLWQNPANADAVTFDDKSCTAHSTSYYCQPVLAATPAPAPAPEVEAASAVACDPADWKVGMTVRMMQGDAEDADHQVPEGAVGVIACFTGQGRPGICYEGWNDGHNNTESCSNNFQKLTTSCTDNNMWFSRTSYLECEEVVVAEPSCTSNAQAASGTFNKLTGDDKSTDNSRDACNAKCIATPGCGAFDWSSDSVSDACRVVAGTEPPRTGNGGGNNREYCTVR